MPRRSSVLLAVAIAAMPAVAYADGGPFGLGIILGQPTGITGEYRLGDHNAIDGAIGLDVINNSHTIYIHADYLFVLGNLIGGGDVGLEPYLGPGAWITANGFSLGVRVPFGLSLDFHRAPLQLFGEVVPGLRLVHDAHLGIGGAIGFRYYF